MESDKNWIHKPESAFGKGTQNTMMIIVSLLLIGAAIGIYFLWHYVNH